MYSVAVTKDFIARHFLVGGDWGAENVTHAHHYVVELSIEGNQLDQHGYLVDIVDIEAALAEAVSYYRDSVLNEKPEFAGLNPSIEHFSRILWEQLSARVRPAGGGTLTIKIWENDSCWAAFRDSV